MNIVKKLLLAAAALSTFGLSALELVRAQANGDITDVAPAQAADPSARFTSGISTSYSFAEITNLSNAGDTLRLANDETGRMRAGTFAELADVAESMPRKQLARGKATSLLGEMSAMNGAFGDFSTMAVADETFTSRSGASRSHADARSLFASADMPEPTYWMTLLCGVVVVAFMARRKRGSFSD